VAAESIYWHILDLDEYELQDRKDLDALEDSDNMDNFIPSNNTDSPHVKLGLRQAAETFKSIDDAHKEDNAFTNFQTNLNEFLTSFLLAVGLPLPNGKHVQLQASDKVSYIHWSNTISLH
jgi:hypothetical protein